MRKKQRQKRLLIALSAALLLVVTVPIIAAFASEGEEAVSGSDVTAQATVSASDNRHENAETVQTVITGKAEPRIAGNNYEHYYDNPEFWFTNLCFYTKVPVYQFAEADQEQMSYDDEADSISFVAPTTSNPINTFLYWKDTQTGKIYYPGQTYSIALEDLKRHCINDDESCHPWLSESVWEGELLEDNTTNYIQFDIPSDAEDAWTDGFNKYDAWDGKNIDYTLKGTYNLTTEQITYYADNDPIRIPADYVPAYKDYKFVEWNTKANGTGTGYQPGDEIPVSETESAQILYAIFDGYTTKGIVRVYCEDWATQNLISTTLACDENGIIPELKMPAALTNATAQFGGWYNTDNGDTYPADTVYRNFNAKEAAWFDEYDNSYVLSLEPVWEGETVTFDRNVTISLEFNRGWNDYEIPVSGVFNNDTWEITFNGDPVFTIPESAIPQHGDGFEFAGWNTSEYGNGTMYLTNVPIHLKDADSIDKAFYLHLYATFQTDSEFGIVVESHDVSNFVKKVQPTADLALAGGLSFDDVKMLVTDVTGQVKNSLFSAISEQADIQTDGDEVNIQPLEITLVDSQRNGVSIEEGRVLIIVDYPNISNARDYNYTMYHYQDGGAIPIHVEKLDDGLAFYADSFSPYALVWEEESYEVPDDDTKTDDNAKTDDDTKADDDAKTDDSSKTDGQQEKAENIAVDDNGNKYTKDQIKINAKKLSAGEAEQYIKLTGEQADSALAYDITLTTADGKTTLKLIEGKTLTVELSRPDVNGKFAFNVYHIESGKAVPVKLSETSGAKIVFDASGFSPYVLAWHEITSTGDAPKTGDSFSPVVLILLLIFSAAAAAGAIYYDRFKRRNGAEA